MKYFETIMLSVVMTVSGAIGNTLPADKAYPEFMIGVTGINASINEGVLAVTKVTPDTPAEGELRPGDVLLAVNSTSLEIQDPRHALGEAINKAEGSDGRMVFKVSRAGKRNDVAIKLNPIGSYSKTWPMNCQKSQRIVDDTAAFIINQGGPEKGITGYCEGLFLLSTGEDKYLPILKKFAHSVSPGKVGSHTWNNGYHGVFLGEYYLRTGDTQVLPTLKALCEDAKERQYYGGWNHWDKPGPGYVTGGLMNPAGVQVLTTLILARECGVDVDEGTYDRALTLFYRFAGHGAVPYGDHHPTMYLGDNGKNGMLACALTLLPDKKFQDAARVLALDEVDSYTMHEQGHGSAFGNQMWRGIAGVLVTDNMMANYRRHMDKLIWYYELCRMPGGGFMTPPMPGSGQRSIGKAPHYETGLISLAYTSHLKNLRITGKPRTQYSVKHRPTEVERNLPYTDSRKPGYVKGGSDLGLEPHEIYAKFSKTYGGWWNTPPAELMSVQWYATMMRHYNPIVRSCAAHALGYLGESGIPEILKALKSPDERLRVAGMEAISGLCFWGPNFTKVKITPDMIKKHFLPHILKPLKDPGASMWEKRHALYVLSRADNKTIAAQTAIIKPYLGDPEWYLRVAACTVIRPLIEETALIKPFLSAMFANLDVDTNLPSRRWGATTIIKEILAKNDDLRAEVMARMAQSVNGTKVRDGYKQPIDINNLFETMRYIAMKQHPEHVVPILPAIERIFPLASGQAGNWIFTGARWGNIGLIKAAASLGKDAGPIITSMKAMLPEIKRRSSKGRDAKTFQTVLEAVTEAIEDYETKYGFVPVNAKEDVSDVIWLEAESFRDVGAWSNDSQHVDVMGSAYLLATGLGTPVKDAVTTVNVTRAGSYRLWVRCRDWYPDHSPGQFKVLVGGKASDTFFGRALNDKWQWTAGGRFALETGELELRLQDLTGWWGRCDALVLVRGDFRPSNDKGTLNQQRETYLGVSADIKDLSGYDVIVVGGGPAGMGAALASGRHRAKVAFIQDRPLLGGNASDEIRIPPMGMIGKAPDQMNVTGIAEELYPIQGWAHFGSSKHYEDTVRAENNISLFLNTRATGVVMKDKKTIQSVLALNVITGQRYRFSAPLIVDTTGHGWVGTYAGADYRMGTEACAEFNESMAPLKANKHTMGNSLYKAVFKDLQKPTPFVTPPWAYQWKSEQDFDKVLARIKDPVRPEAFDKAMHGQGRRVSASGLQRGGAYTWYVELGGMSDIIEDAEKIRDELFRIHMGLWGYTKNYSSEAPKNETLKMVWLNYVPGVRESRRLMGDYMMTQTDFDQPVVHEDTVAFTDWGIDDHHPEGFFTKGIDVMHVYAGRRVSISYRSLYSRNIENLFMAGRCMSASHLALAGVRVQRPMTATGQVVGIAAALATRYRTSPRGIYKSHLKELQQVLLKDGCYLMGIKNEDQNDLALSATTSTPQIINGWNRESRGLPLGADWQNFILLKLKEVSKVSEIHVTVNRNQYAAEFMVEVETPKGWNVVARATVKETDKGRRHVFTFGPEAVKQVRLTLLESQVSLRLCEVRVYQ